MIIWKYKIEKPYNKNQYSICKKVFPYGQTSYGAAEELK